MSNRVSGQVVACNIIDPTTIKVGVGRCCMVSPLGDGGGVEIHDCADPLDVDPSNMIARCSGNDFISCILVDMPYFVGLTIVPTDAIAISVCYT